jgi:hypothetical protein
MIVPEEIEYRSVLEIDGASAGSFNVALLRRSKISLPPA